MRRVFAPASPPVTNNEFLYDGAQRPLPAVCRSPARNAVRSFSEHLTDVIQAATMVTTRPTERSNALLISTFLWSPSSRAVRPWMAQMGRLVGSPFLCASHTLTSALVNEVSYESRSSQHGTPPSATAVVAPPAAIRLVRGSRCQAGPAAGSCPSRVRHSGVRSVGRGGLAGHQPSSPRSRRHSARSP